MTPEQGLARARELIDAGIPVLTSTPRRGWKPGNRDGDLSHPMGWGRATADHKALDDFRPGKDTLSMVGGHGLDVIDLDCKIPGVTLADLPDFAHFGFDMTPSTPAGYHLLVPSTGLGKGTIRTPGGKNLGDYIGGTRAGGGRMLCYLPGSVRPKYPQSTYTVGEPWDIAAALDSEPDPVLVDWLTGVCGLSDTATAANPAATSEAVQAFLDDHADAEGCGYGAKALAGILADAPALEDNQHPFFGRSVNRLWEMIGGGCLSSTALADLKVLFDKAKPEGASEWVGFLTWAAANVAAAPCDHTLAKLDAVILDLYGDTGEDTAGSGESASTDDSDSDDAGDGNGDEPGTDEEANGEDRYWTDLTWLLTGTPPPRPTPVWVTRSDGVALFYPGAVNGLFGPPECGKTWVAHVAVVEALKAGQRAAVLDADHNGEVVSATRLVAMGVAPEILADPDQFRYIEPDGRGHLRRAIADLADWSPAVVVLDSLGELLPLLGASSNDNDETTLAMRLLTVDLVAAGACVVTIDHVAKNTDTGSGYAIGAGAKKRATRGSYLQVTRVAEFAPGKTGKATLKIEKDSVGSLREKSTGGNAGTFTLDATNPAAVAWTIDTGEASTEFRPTVLMERVSRWLEAHPGEHSRSECESNVTGKAAYIRQALDVLADEGWIIATETVKGTRTEHRYSHTRRYRDGMKPDPSHTRPDPSRDVSTPTRPVPVPPVPPPTGGTGRDGTGRGTGTTPQNGYPSHEDGTGTPAGAMVEGLFDGTAAGPAEFVEPPTPTDHTPHAGEKCPDCNADVDPIHGFCWTCREAS